MSMIYEKLKAEQKPNRMKQNKQNNNNKQEANYGGLNKNGPMPLPLPLAGQAHIFECLVTRE